MLVQFVIASGLTVGAPERGVMVVIAILAGSWLDFSVAILAVRPSSNRISRVISCSQSTMLSVPQVPAVPMTRGQPAWWAALTKPAHSDFVDSRAYFDTPLPR